MSGRDRDRPVGDSARQQFAEVIGELFSALVPQGGVLCQRPEHHSIECVRQLRVQVRDGRGVLAGYLVQERAGVSLKRFPPGEHPVKDHPQRKQVRAPVQGIAFQLLGRQVSERAENLAGERKIALLQLGNSEIRDLCPAVRGDQDVGRLDITVDDVLGVSVIERLGHLLDQPERLGHGRGSQFRVGQKAIEGLPLDVLHDDVGCLGSRVFVDVVDGNDPRVRELARRLRLADEAPPVLVFLLRGRPHHADGFESDDPAYLGVLRPIDRPHRPVAQLCKDLVTSQLLHQ